MTNVKMFTRIELNKNIDFNFLDWYGGNFCNDVAVSWSVEEPSDEMEPEDVKINEYFLSHGAKPGEKVWIDVTW